MPLRAGLGAAEGKALIRWVAVHLWKSVWLDRACVALVGLSARR